MIRNERKLVFYIFFIFHFIPFLYLYSRKVYISNFYRGDVGDFKTLLYSIMFFTITYLFTKVNLKTLSLKRFTFIFNKRLVSLLIIIFFLLSIYFFKNYGLNFRQTSEGLSSGGAILFLHLILKNYLKTLLFIEFIFQYKLKRNFLSKRNRFLILISLSLSISGSLDIILIAYSALVLLKPRLIVLKGSLRYLLILGALLISILFVGIANKLGVSETFIIFRLENFKILFEHLLKRISTWHQSIEVMGNEFLFSFERNIDILKSILQNTLSRFQIIVGNNFEKPEIWSLSRYNYLLLFQNNTNAITGSSPGIVASSLILFPFTFIFLAICLGQIIKSIFRLVNKETNILFDIFIILVILYPILSSPIDLLNIFSPGAVFLFSFIVALSYLKIKTNEFTEG